MHLFRGLLEDHTPGIIERPGLYLESREGVLNNWVAAKELNLSYHNGYIYIYSK